VHTKRTPPEEDEDGGAGGFPLTTTPPPNMAITYGMAHIGRTTPISMRMMASTTPMGVHKRMRRAVAGVGRFTKRPSWKITGTG